MNWITYISFDKYTLLFTNFCFMLPYKKIIFANSRLYFGIVIMPKYFIKKFKIVFDCALVHSDKIFNDVKIIYECLQ